MATVALETKAKSGFSKKYFKPFSSNLSEIILKDPLQGLTVLFVWWTCIIGRF
jgi:hypothetical protein